MEYTENQLKDMYLSYEEVRLSGEFNMFDPRARDLTGLSKEQYIYVMKHYNELKNKFGGK